ncbi:hypothetical protein E2C01_101001 [Portunus trituberculatus]|uniref:Uncharacterized protein n=1 Tax=Portunus trituberculatus TaxID=210409 RepID=A0A5B7KIY9_PORTR|nr:hypothetical protein [Portunus trituberculatus]
MLSLVTAAIFHESTYRKVPPAHDTMVSCLSLLHYSLENLDHNASLS